MEEKKKGRKGKKSRQQRKRERKSERKKLDREGGREGGRTMRQDAEEAEEIPKRKLIKRRKGEWE